MRRRTNKRRSCRRLRGSGFNKIKAQTQLSFGQSGGACPPGMPPSICHKREEREKRNKYSVTRNFKINLEQSLRNRERRLLPEEERVAEARAAFNWKSRVPRFNAIRRGDGNENNISNKNLQNIHNATNLNFPLSTGTPAAFNTFTGPPPLGPMRKKIYRNNNMS